MSACLELTDACEKALNWGVKRFDSTYKTKDGPALLKPLNERDLAVFKINVNGWIGGSMSEGILTTSVGIAKEDLQLPSAG
jgi:hypothetical protein